LQTAIKTELQTQGLGRDELRESLIPSVGRWRYWWRWYAWLAEHAFTERPIAERRHEILAKPFCVSRCNDISVHVWALRYFEINLY